MNQKLSIVIPIYNEKDNINSLHERVSNALKTIGREYEIILVNDGSFDGSTEELDKVAAADSHVKVVHFRRNFGQTAAMMAGIDFASGEIIIPMDGDLQNDPEDIAKLLSKLDEGYDVCSGWRKDRKDNPIKRNIPSSIANMLISKISGVHLHDYGCSLKAYKKDVLKGVRLYGEMHRFIPIYASWHGAEVTEIPVNHRARMHGKSKYGLERTFKVVLDLMVVKFMDKYNQKPMYVFGGIGMINIVLSFLSFLWMLCLKYVDVIFGSAPWDHKNFSDTPLPLLVVLFFMIGVNSILLGLIAEMLMRTYYESQEKKTYLVERTCNLDKAD